MAKTTNRHATPRTPPKPTLNFRQHLEAAIAQLQSRRAVLGGPLVDAALGPLFERLAALSEQPAPAEPARRLRQVSVLFLDIVGSTQLTQHIDPEEVQAVFDSALAAFAAIVTRHGGEVLRYAGDNIKAAFGAHEGIGTREDDAERAVHCGLALLIEAASRGDAVQRRHGQGTFNARVGIHTGSALRGGGVESDNSLSGLAVNIAARLEQAAPAGTLLVSQDTWALVRGSFDAEVQPPLAVKGVEAPITSWLVRAAKPRATRLQARGIHGQETPLTGRHAEMARFQATLKALLAERTSRALTVVADAGLGKSRLLYEFQRTLWTHETRWWLMPARSQPSGALQPYGLFRDLLARRLEIADSDSADVARGKLVQGLAPWLAQPGDPAPELLGHLIGLDFSASPAVQRLGADARLLRDRAVTALRLWLERLAASDGSPVVLLLDDLHWADDASLDALLALLKSAKGPLLALLCARPGLLERRPGWGQGLPQHETLTLQRLGEAEGSELTRALLRRLNPVPEALTELIERRAEGNPFYAEELVGMLLDQGVITGPGPHDVMHDSLDAGPDSHGSSAWRFHAERLHLQRLPTTVTGVLQARLDALDAEARRALQMASVIGPVFWEDALGVLEPRGPQALPLLQRKSFVQPRPSSAFDDTHEAAFQHHLLHQVTYDTVLKPEKREAHALAAAWLTQRVGDRSDEYLAITAEHHARAGQHALAAEWFIRASVRAKGRFAYTAALLYIERAEAQATLGPAPLPLALQHELLNRRVLVCDSLALREPQAEAIERLLALGETHGNNDWIADALAAQTMLAQRTGKLALAEAAGRRGAAVAESIDHAKNAALCRLTLAFMATEQRAFDQARQDAAAAMRWAVLARERMREPRDDLFEVQVLLVQARLHGAEGDEDANGDVLTRALALASQLDNPRLTCACLEYVTERALGRCDWAEAAAHIEAGARLATDFGLPLQAAISQGLRSLLHLNRGEYAAAADEAAASAQAYRACGGVVGAMTLGSVQAEALWRAGNEPAAVAIWQEIEVALKQHGDDMGACALRLRLADARAASGRAEDIMAARQAVLAELAELPALQKRDALATSYLGLAARLAGWRVLQRAGSAAAPGQLALAAAELEQVLSGYSDPKVRERARNTPPWHRDVVEAVARHGASG